MDCCAPKGKASGLACPRCDSPGRNVGDETVRAILRPDVAQMRTTDLRFCKTPSCDVLYYGTDGIAFDKSAANVRVGQKEREDPIPICYCFGFSRADARAELQATGACTIEDRIRAEMTNARCACETKNPSGACCLGDVRKAIEDERARLAIPRPGRLAAK